MSWRLRCLVFVTFLETSLQKHAWLKLGQAIRSDCLASGLCDIADPVFRNFSKYFIKNIEHTWGR